MKRILIAGLAALTFAVTGSLAEAMPRVPAAAMSDAGDAVVQVRGGHGHGHGGFMRRGGRGHHFGWHRGHGRHYGWSRGRHRGW